MPRALLSLVFALVVLAGPRLQAAIGLLASSNANVSFSTVTGYLGNTSLSTALTITTNAYAAGQFGLASIWGATGPDQVFLFYFESNEVGYIISTGSGIGNANYGCMTTTDPIPNGSATYRIMARATPLVACEVFVNGVQQTTTITFNPPGFDGLRNNAPLQIGHNTNLGFDGVDGDYAEFAQWVEFVPDWVAIAYGKGMSPMLYRQNGLFYMPLTNTSGLRDVWGGNLGTNTAGTDAVHPRMYYPESGQ